MIGHFLTQRHASKCGSKPKEADKIGSGAGSITTSTILITSTS